MRIISHDLGHCYDFRLVAYEEIKFFHRLMSWSVNPISDRIWIKSNLRFVRSNLNTKFKFANWIQIQNLDSNLDSNSIRKEH